jgi:serine/threonine-protein kinase
MRPCLLQLGSIVGDYRILGFLGRGGMGEVYRAQHMKLGRVVAIKILTGALQDATALERFRNEARIQSRLQHANIATLYDFMEVDGRPCIIMEYVDGLTLTELIARRGQLSVSEALDIFRSLVKAIAYVHECGIVHRDLKPNNIKVDSKGEAKLLDFGIARAELTPRLTASGHIVGTIEYLAPEQLQTGCADRRSDIWALGALLYEMLTGRAPFAASTIGEICDRINRAAYEPPSHLNPAIFPELEGLIARCLKRDPSARYRSADELLADVERLGRQLEQRAARSPRDRLEPAKMHRRQWALIGVAAGTLIVLIILAFWASSYNEGQSGSVSLTRSVAQSAFLSPKVDSTIGTARPHTIIIDVFEGHAQVYRDNQLLGTTPYELTALPGQVVRLNLKSEGFKDKTVEFTVSETRNVYTFRMER